MISIKRINLGGAIDSSESESNENGCGYVVWKTNFCDQFLRYYMP